MKAPGEHWALTKELAANSLGQFAGIRRSPVGHSGLEFPCSPVEGDGSGMRYGPTSEDVDPQVVAVSA